MADAERPGKPGLSASCGKYTFMNTGVVMYRLFNFWLPIVPALALMPAIRDLRERFHKAEQTTT